MPTFPQYISGKTTVNSPFCASTDRYTFLSLDNAEPNLGAPTGPDGYYVLLSDPVSGVRVWSNVSALTSDPKAGQDTQIIFNSGGRLVGSYGLTYNYNLSTITVGRNNTNTCTNSFVLGSNLVASRINTTFVNNLSTPGFVEGIYGAFSSFYVSDGKSGFGTNTPNEKVTIVGNLSVTDTIYGRVSAEKIKIAQDTMVIFNSAGNLTGLSSFRFFYSLSGLSVGSNQCLTPGSQYSGILGGLNNTIIGSYSNVTNGEGNSARADYSTVAGGCVNIACGVKSFVGGGSGNKAGNSNSIVGGGQDNSALGVQSVIGGGRLNIANSDYSSVLGGYSNCTYDTYSVVNGGYFNVVDGGGIYGAIGGGNDNYVNGMNGVVAGGFNNYVTTNFGGILGGCNNCVQHVKSFVIGADLKTQAACTTFVNNLSTPGTIYASTLCVQNLSGNGYAFGPATTVQTATATDAFLTLNVNGSALALLLYRLIP